MAIPKLTPFGPAPNRNDPDNFRPRMDNTLASVVTFVPEMNTAIDSIVATQTSIEASKTSATSAAQTAQSAAEAAASSANALPWVSGQTYSLGVSAISRINFQTYRKRTNTTGGTVDPSNDSVNWRIVATNGAFVPEAITGSDIDLARGRYFTRTISSNTTFTFSNIPQDGYGFTLELAVTAGSVTFPATVRTANNVPLVLTTNKTHLLMFVTSNGGGNWKLVVAGNYAI